MKRILVFTLFCSSQILMHPAVAQSGFKIVKSFAISGNGGWDYLAIAPASNRLYVSHGTQVNVIDKRNGDSLGVIENTTGVHGIAFDLKAQRGYTSNGRLNNVTVFDLASNRELAHIATGENPDAILFEEYTGKIITCNGRSHDLSVIDPVLQKVVATIPVGGKPETAVSDGQGKLFVNIEDKSEIVLVNLVTMQVEARWPLAPAEEPTGLALDKVSHRLFAGCGNQLMAVLDAGSGKLLETLPIGSGCDGIAFDSATGNIFASNGEGTLSVYHEEKTGAPKLLQTVKTKRGARTITLDPETHFVYLPTAEFETPSAASAAGRPNRIAGTFQVLVVAQ